MCVLLATQARSTESAHHWRRTIMFPLIACIESHSNNWSLLNIKIPVLLSILWDNVKVKCAIHHAVRSESGVLIFCT